MGNSESVVVLSTKAGYALENSALDNSPFWSVSSSVNWLISEASTDASAWLIAPLPSTSSVSKSVAAKAADEEAKAFNTSVD